MSARRLSLAAVLLLAGCGGGEKSTTIDVASSTQTSTSSTEASTTSTSTSTAGEHGAGGQGGKATPALGTPASSVEATLTSTDPAVACEQAITAAYLRVAYGNRAGCAAAIRSGGQARSVRVASVDAAGDQATVKAVPSGGPSDGDTLTVSLVLESEAWRVDAIHSNAPVGP